MRHHTESRLLVLGFDDENSAFDLRSVLFDLEDASLIELADAVVATRSRDGRVRLHQSMTLVAGHMAAGSVAGLVAGLLLANPLLGIVAGGGVGALSGVLSDRGIPDPFMQELATTLKPGGSALFLSIRKSDPDQILARLGAFAGRGRLLQTTIPSDDEVRLREFFEKTWSREPAE